MNDNPTPEEMRASIVPKSDQLNADDLTIGPITVTITGVRRGDREQPIIVELEGHRPYKPCKTMRRILIATFSDDPIGWIGQQMTLYRDPDVLWAGVKVGGIRISHLSGLSKPKTYIVTEKRGKRAEVLIQPIASLSPEDLAAADKAAIDIAKAETMEILKAVGFVVKQQSKAVQDAVRPLYVKRQRELQ